MRTVVIDAPEVMQRTLAQVLEARGIGHAFAPDRRVDEPSPPETTDDGLAGRASDADVALWFAGASSSVPQPPDAIIRTLLDAAVARVILVVPLRVSGQPPTPAEEGLRATAASFAGGVAIVGSAPAYGPGDELVSRLLIMMRSLPVIPLLGRGQRRYQPIWHRDLAEALLALHRPGEALAIYRLAGLDLVTQASLYDTLAPLLDRRPARVPLPDFLTTLGLAVIDVTSGTDRGTADAPWGMEADHEPLAPEDNDLARLLTRAPTPLETGLRLLAESMPVQLPDTGVGGLDVKHFWGVISGTALTPPGVLQLFRDRFADVMPVPVGVEPAAGRTRLDVGATVTIHLPGRGHVQVRVEAADEAHVVLSTLRGHALAGVVRFRTAAAPGGVRFEVMTGDKAATPADWLALTLGAARIQDANWRAAVTRVAEIAGGTVDAVQSHVRRATEPEVTHLSTWIARLANDRQTS